MSNKGHQGVQGVQGVQGELGEGVDPTPSLIGIDDRIDPGFDLNKAQLSKCVEEAMAGTDFSAVLDVYFKEMEDRITSEIVQANAESSGGYNLSSAAACRFLAERIVNTVLRPPHKEEAQHGEEI
jgi:hypothetical protein